MVLMKIILLFRNIYLINLFLDFNLILHRCFLFHLFNYDLVFINFLNILKYIILFFLISLLLFLILYRFYINIIDWFFLFLRFLDLNKIFQLFLMALPDSFQTFVVIISIQMLFIELNIFFVLNLSVKFVFNLQSLKSFFFLLSFQISFIFLHIFLYNERINILHIF